MTTQTIEQITTALQKLMYFSYVAFLKTNQGFEIEDERNGYESEQFTEDIQKDCGIEFSRATTDRYGADFTLHYKMVLWLYEIFLKYQLPLTFTSKLQNRSGSDQIYVNRLGPINNAIDYDLDALKKLSADDLEIIAKKLEIQITCLTLKYQ